MIPVFPGRATCSMALWTSCIWVSQTPPCATEHCEPRHLSTVTKAHASPTSRRHARHLRPSPLTTRGMLKSARQCTHVLSFHGGLLLFISHCSRPTTPPRDGHHTCAAAAPRRLGARRPRGRSPCRRCVPPAGRERLRAPSPGRRRYPRGSGYGRRRCRHRPRAGRRHSAVQQIRC